MPTSHWSVGDAWRQFETLGIVPCDVRAIGSKLTMKARAQSIAERSFGVYDVCVRSSKVDSIGIHFVVDIFSMIYFTNKTITG